MRSLFFLVLLTSLFASCESDYSRLVKSEMATDKIYTELIFDLNIGQTKKEFYSTCWTLNSQKVISQGPGNNYARYIIEEEFENDSIKIEMLFYGIFDKEEKMIGMDMKMSHLSYAPWNEESHSDSVIEFLKTFYQRDYPGNGFIEIDLDVGYGDAWVKIDGNRQILMYPLSQKDVVVKIEDLRYKDLVS